MAGNYVVVAQRQSSDVSATGQLVDVMDITFSTVPEGVEGTVRVPLSQYDAATVDAAIAARVAAIQAVSAL